MKEVNKLMKRNENNQEIKEELYEIKTFVTSRRVIISEVVVVVVVDVVVTSQRFVAKSINLRMCYV